LSLCLSVCLPACLSVFLPVCLSSFLSVRLIIITLVGMTKKFLESCSQNSVGRIDNLKTGSLFLSVMAVMLSQLDQTFKLSSQLKCRDCLCGCLFVCLTVFLPVFLPVCQADDNYFSGPDKKVFRVLFLELSRQNLQLDDRFAVFVSDGCHVVTTRSNI
jgi:hypothetical protein